MSCLKIVPQRFRQGNATLVVFLALLTVIGFAGPIGSETMHTYRLAREQQRLAQYRTLVYSALQQLSVGESVEIGVYSVTRHPDGVVTIRERQHYTYHYWIANDKVEERLVRHDS